MIAFRSWLLALGFSLFASRPSLLFARTKSNEIDLNTSINLNSLLLFGLNNLLTTQYLASYFCLPGGRSHISFLTAGHCSSTTTVYLILHLLLYTDQQQAVARLLAAQRSIDNERSFCPQGNPSHPSPHPNHKWALELNTQSSDHRRNGHQPGTTQQKSAPIGSTS